MNQILRISNNHIFIDNYCITMKIKHSKYKNTGLIFELLVRKITSDTLSENESPAVNIIKEFFTNTELSKEYKVYKHLVNSKTSHTDKIYSVIDATLNESKKLNRTSLRKEKYNLIREIRKHYNLNDFFKAKLPNYKVYASIYSLIEESASSKFVNPEFIIKNKETLAEHIAHYSSVKKPSKDKLMEDYANESKDIRILTYKILLENFNQKYSNMSDKQKLVLKEYINNITETPRLRDFINEELTGVKMRLSILMDSVDDQVTSIKLKEVISFISEIPKSRSVKENNVLDLLQYLELEKELS